MEVLKCVELAFEMTKLKINLRIPALVLVALHDEKDWILIPGCLQICQISHCVSLRRTPQGSRIRTQQGKGVLRTGQVEKRKMIALLLKEKRRNVEQMQRNIARLHRSFVEMSDEKSCSGATRCGGIISPPAANRFHHCHTPQQCHHQRR
jgi:hypothetical protein